MALRIQSNTPTSGPASAASFGVGLATGDGGAGAIAQGLRQVAGATGQWSATLAKKVAKRDELIGRDYDSRYRTKITNLSKELGNSETSSAREAEIIETMDSMNPETYDFDSLRNEEKEERLLPDDVKNKLKISLRETHAERYGSAYNTSIVRGLNRKLKEETVTLESAISDAYQKRDYSVSSLANISTMANTLALDMADVFEEGNLEIAHQKISDMLGGHIATALNELKESDDFASIIEVTEAAKEVIGALSWMNNKEKQSLLKQITTPKVTKTEQNTRILSSSNKTLDNLWRQNGTGADINGAGMSVQRQMDALGGAEANPDLNSRARLFSAVANMQSGPLSRPFALHVDSGEGGFDSFSRLVINNWAFSEQWRQMNDTDQGKFLGLLEQKYDQTQRLREDNDEVGVALAMNAKLSKDSDSITSQLRAGAPMNAGDPVLKDFVNKVNEENPRTKDYPVFIEHAWEQFRATGDLSTLGQRFDEWSATGGMSNSVQWAETVLQDSTIPPKTEALATMIQVMNDQALMMVDGEPKANTGVFFTALAERYNETTRASGSGEEDKVNGPRKVRESRTTSALSFLEEDEKLSLNYTNLSVAASARGPDYVGVIDATADALAFHAAGGGVEGVDHTDPEFIAKYVSEQLGNYAVILTDGDRKPMMITDPDVKSMVASGRWQAMTSKHKRRESTLYDQLADIFFEQIPETFENSNILDFTVPPNATRAQREIVNELNLTVTPRDQLQQMLDSGDASFVIGRNKRNEAELYFMVSQPNTRAFPLAINGKDASASWEGAKETLNNWERWSPHSARIEKNFADAGVALRGSLTHKYKAGSFDAQRINLGIPWDFIHIRRDPRSRGFGNTLSDDEIIADWKRLNKIKQ